MSKATRIKEQKRKRRQQEIEKQQELEELEELENETLLEKELKLDDGDVETVEKDYYGEVSREMGMGPLSFDELDSARKEAEKASQVRRTTWDVEDLVHNIIANPMLKANEKADYIKKVGNDFGTRVQGIMSEPAGMKKESEEDSDVLELEAIIAHDERNLGILEKAWNGIQKKTLSSGARNALPDESFALPKERKYPIHDKAHVRNALARAAQQIKEGGAGAEDAKRALPNIRVAAKKMGIETSMEKEANAITVQKDANGDWRWVGWVSNNFIDHSGDILIEKAHVEYVDWLQKNLDKAPVFTSMHAPGTARTHPVDFAGYENGFLVMSGKLTDEEAMGLLRVQKEYDIGMSHTGWAMRDKADPRQVVLYRLYEVTDLPVQMADNPFTELAVHTKEADTMEKEAQLKYLTELLGSKERAEEALTLKTSMKQAELQEAGVEQKEAKPEAEETPAVPEQTAAAGVDVKELIKQIGQEFDIDGLNEAFGQMTAELDKLPVLEQLVKQQADTIQKLQGAKEDALVEMITPPAGRFAWSQKARASQSEETEVEGEEKEKLQKKQAGIPADDDYWLSQALGIPPVQSEA